MLTVACVLRSGGIYSADWVTKLHNGIRRHLKEPIRFVCLTDGVVPGIETKPLISGFPGWWAKIELFREGLFNGPVLYLDLDTVIVGSLDWVKDELATLSDGHMRATPQFIGKGINSSVLLFSGDFSMLWDMFFNSPGEHVRIWDKVRPGGLIGDQGFIEHSLAIRGREVTLLPRDRIVSYKRDCRQGPPERASVVCFHGRPKPSDLTVAPKWVSDHWNR